MRKVLTGTPSASYSGRGRSRTPKSRSRAKSFCACPKAAVAAPKHSEHRSTVLVARLIGVVPPRPTPRGLALLSWCYSRNFRRRQGPCRSLWKRCSLSDRGRYWNCFRRHRLTRRYWSRFLRPRSTRRYCHHSRLGRRCVHYRGDRNHHHYPGTAGSPKFQERAGAIILIHQREDDLLQRCQCAARASAESGGRRFSQDTGTGVVAKRLGVVEAERKRL